MYISVTARQCFRCVHVFMYTCIHVHALECIETHVPVSCYMQELILKSQGLDYHMAPNFQEA